MTSIKPPSFTTICVIFLFVSVSIDCVAAGPGWRTGCDLGSTTNCEKDGLRTRTYTNSDGTDTTGSLDSSSRAYKGGTIILATGVIGIFVYVVSMVVLCLGHNKGVANWRYFSLAGLYCSVGLLILGIVLYAYKLQAGYSFILMTVSGFFYFVGTVLVVASGWSVGEGTRPKEGVPDNH